ncbi:hypothetical protein HN789_02495 [archaeon]|jgi:hypothetical protein|nr:hypothetical protein [archaeon]MBT4021926.1 hypothetical protein [archaeon]MBT4272243.1 hypothetical protein [archaeon]MBT4460779.1 hypothetical protein [archaeon]MBT4858347.1 hypothetical protein [archaeon]
MQEPVILASNGWLFEDNIDNHVEILRQSDLNGVEYGARNTKKRLNQVLSHELPTEFYQSLHLPHAETFGNSDEHYQTCSELLSQKNPVYAVIHPTGMSET